jgi:hypothetical protein
VARDVIEYLVVTRLVPGVQSRDELRLEHDEAKAPARAQREIPSSGFRPQATPTPDPEKANCTRPRRQTPPWTRGESLRFSKRWVKTDSTEQCPVDSLTRCELKHCVTEPMVIARARDGLGPATIQT